jgi:LmbE family N-acetylglucosaminyl deacetylase
MIPRGFRLLSRLPGGVSPSLPTAVHRRLNALRGIEQPALVTLPPGRRIAVLAPHPDDELLGCGATLAKHAAAGHALLVVFVSSGEASLATSGSRSERIEIREREAGRAASVAFPSAQLRFLRLPDGGLAARSDELTAHLRRALGDWRADLVYAPHPAEPHGDHAAVARALILLFDRNATASVRHVAWYEVWSPLPATHVVDITAQMAAKLAGLSHYASQLDVVDYRRATEGLAAYRSFHAMRGSGFAEAFEVLNRAQLKSLAKDLEP